MADFRKSVFRIKAFTLAELIAVIAIILLLAGVVIGRTGKVPAFISFENTIGRIRTVFSEASRISSVQGKDVKVLFNEESKAFQIGNISNESKVQKNFTSCTLPENIEIIFDEKSDDGFIFYPDGTASGPAFKVSCKGHSRLMELSQLTGSLIVKELEE